MSNNENTKQARALLVERFGQDVYWLASAITVTGMSVGHLRRTGADAELITAMIQYSSELVTEICNGRGIPPSMVYACVEEINALVQQKDPSVELPADNHTH